MLNEEQGDKRERERAGVYIREGGSVWFVYRSLGEEPFAWNCEEL